MHYYTHSIIMKITNRKSWTQRWQRSKKTWGNTNMTLDEKRKNLNNWASINLSHERKHPHAQRNSSFKTLICKKESTPRRRRRRRGYWGGEATEEAPLVTPEINKAKRLLCLFISQSSYRMEGDHWSTAARGQRWRQVRWEKGGRPF